MLGKRLGALAQSSFASVAGHYGRAAGALNKLLVRRTIVKRLEVFLVGNLKEPQKLVNGRSIVNHQAYWMIAPFIVRWQRLTSANYVPTMGQ